MSTEINTLMIKNVIDELNTAFTEFKRTNDERLKLLETNKTDPIASDKIERLNTLMDQLGAKLSQEKRPKATQERPFLEDAGPAHEQEQKALRDYLLTGNAAAVKALEAKHWTGQSQEAGGCFLTPTQNKEIIGRLENQYPMMNLAKTVTVPYGSGSHYEYLRVKLAFDAYFKDAKGKERWEKGLGDDEETGSLTPEMETVKIPLHSINYTPRINMDLMESKQEDVGAILQTIFLDKANALSNFAFINGDGNKKPKGLLHASNCAANGEGYKIKEHKTNKNGDFTENKEYETLLDVFYSLPSRYKNGASLLIHPELMKKIRLIKGADRYLWSPEKSISGNESSFLGYPVITCDELQPLSDNGVSMVFGNFKEGYTVCYREGPIRLIVDHLSAKPDIELLMQYSVGGDVTDGRALQALKFAE
jgi:HK97 family phage major capsid protein